MIAKFPLFTVLIFGLVSQNAIASETEVLTWKFINLKFDDGDDNTSLEADTDGQKYQKFVINTFDRRFELSPDELKMIEGFPISSLETRHEGGYEGYGGPLKTFKLSRSYYRRHGESDRVVFITISKEDGMRVTIEGP
jgi:hypothetical protein